MSNKTRAEVLHKMPLARICEACSDVRSGKIGPIHAFYFMADTEIYHALLAILENEEIRNKFANLHDSLHGVPA